jgi:hypothetical protein
MSIRFAQNRDALHTIAEEVLSPTRVKATGNEIALRATPDEAAALAFFRDRRDALPG